MARKRMIDPNYWLNEDLARLSPHARLLYIGLWGISDDNYATFPNRSEWIKAQIFPYEQVNITQLLSELSESGHIILFSVEGKEYWHIPTFFNHQHVEKPSKPKYPEFTEAKKANAPIVVGEESGNTLAEEKRREEKRIVKGNEISPSPEKKSSTISDSVKEKEKPLHKTRQYIRDLQDDKLPEEMREFIKNYKVTSANVKTTAEKIINYENSHGKRYKDYRSTLCNWLNDDFGSRKFDSDKHL